MHSLIVNNIVVVAAIVDIEGQICGKVIANAEGQL